MIQVVKILLLWVNEIRLSGIENKGGLCWNTQILNFNLGDFATVNAVELILRLVLDSYEPKTCGTVSQTTNSALLSNTMVNVDKFLPEKLGLKIPVNYSLFSNHRRS